MTMTTSSSAAPKFALEEFIEAAEQLRNLRHLEPLERELKLTQEEFANLKNALEPIVGWRPYGFNFKAPDHPEFMGLKIVIKP